LILARVTDAPGRINPIWDVLHPEEQRRVLELLVEKITSLAPEIAERILTGDEPEGISLAKLRTDLPVVWKEQEWG
jgi:hypothetical protein